MTKLLLIALIGVVGVPVFAGTIAIEKDSDQINDFMTKEQAKLAPLVGFYKATGVTNSGTTEAFGLKIVSGIIPSSGASGTSLIPTLFGTIWICSLDRSKQPRTDCFDADKLGDRSNKEKITDLGNTIYSLYDVTHPEKGGVLTMTNLSSTGSSIPPTFTLTAEYDGSQFSGRLFSSFVGSVTKAKLEFKKVK